MVPSAPLREENHYFEERSTQDMATTTTAFAGVYVVPSVRQFNGTNSFHCFSTGRQLCRNSCSRRRPRIVWKGNVSSYSSPLSSLNNGTWFKLICGASSHDAPSIYNLCMIYTAAGVDCLDVACDPAIIRVARTGIRKGLGRRLSTHPPLLMVSINAGTDPHFRKAFFRPGKCPSDCPRPCETVCPVDAINLTGVVTDRCYGCGRCVPVCPLGLVDTSETKYSSAYVAEVLAADDVDAVEIHVRPGQQHEFRELWKDIGSLASKLKLVAVSLPDMGEDQILESELRNMWEIMRYGTDGTVLAEKKLLWQADGRPMSGDIGRGTARASITLAIRIRSALNRAGLPGEVQLAGGTNHATGPLMENAGLRRLPGRPICTTAAGIAIGGYARKVRRCFFLVGVQMLRSSNPFNTDMNPPCHDPFRCPNANADCPANSRGVRRS